MGDQDGGADGVIAAAGGVGAVNADQDGNTHLLQLGVTVEGRAAGNAAGVDLLLLIQLHAGAVEHVDQRDAQHLGDVGRAGQLQRLTGDPRAGQLLVVGGDDHGPLVMDLAQTDQNAGGAVLVVAGIIQAVQRAPGVLVHQDLQTLTGSHLAGLVQGLVAAARAQRGLDRFVVSNLNILQGLLVFLVHRLQRRSQLGHILEVGGHGVAKCAHIVPPYFEFGRRE